MTARTIVGAAGPVQAPPVHEGYVLVGGRVGVGRCSMCNNTEVLCWDGGDMSDMCCERCWRSEWAKPWNWDYDHPSFVSPFGIIENPDPRPCPVNIHGDTGCSGWRSPDHTRSCLEADDARP